MNVKLVGTTFNGVQVEKEFDAEDYAYWELLVIDIQKFIQTWVEINDPLVSYRIEDPISVLD